MVKHLKAAGVLDRAILSIAPQHGLRRIQARTRAGALMNFDGASRGRRVKGWKAPATDADAASSVGRARLRQLSRDMIRNAPFARRAQSVVANNVVGAGIIPAIKAGNKALKKKAETHISGHLLSNDLDVHGRLNVYGMQDVVINSVFESGEILLHRRMVSAGNSLLLPFQVELLEIDHLNDTIQTHGANEVRDGIEYDDAGRAVAYHLYAQHPGAASRKVTLKTRRIPASEIIHVRRIDRPGQDRGVPWLAPVMLTLGELRDYQEAQQLKQKISALMAGVVELGEGDQVPDGGSGMDQLAPGALVYTESGQKVTWTDPPKVDGFEAVIRLGLSAVAMGVGITVESLTGDLSRVNFSASRAGRLEMDANVKSWQTRIMIEQLCAGLARWCLEGFRLVPGSKPGVSIGWTPPVRPLIDPNKEIPAIIKKIEAGLSSLQREQRGMGMDPDEVHLERVEDAKRAIPDPEDPGAQDPPAA